MVARTALIAAIALSFVQPAHAQSGIDLGTPATEGAGSSSTTVTVLGGAGSVTLGGSGALDVYSRSGTADGAMALSPAVSARGEEVASTLEISGSGGRLLPAMALDPDGNGIVDATEQDAVRGFAASQASCDGVIVSTASPEQIIGIERPQALSLMLVCALPDGLDPERRAAIAANPALMDRLASAGYGLGDVAGIVLDASGRGTLFLAAS